MFTNRGKALTFDDILLVPGFSDITPDAVDISTWLTPEIPLRIPLLSAAMDTVTEAAMAISMARMGGIGIIHKNMPVARQRLEVEKVKKSESGMILDPVTISPNNTVQEALDLMSDFRVSGLPVVDDGRLVGIWSSISAFRWAFIVISPINRSKHRAPCGPLSGCAGKCRVRARSRNGLPTTAAIMRSAMKLAICTAPMLTDTAAR